MQLRLAVERTISERGTEHVATVTNINAAGQRQVLFMSGMTLQAARLSRCELRGQHEEYIAKALHDGKSGYRIGGRVAAMAEVAYR